MLLFTGAFQCVCVCVCVCARADVRAGLCISVYTHIPMYVHVSRYEDDNKLLINRKKIACFV